jgi:catechol 2,3-dioxygenase-like lactoylglutathione lyase family enzyme
VSPARVVHVNVNCSELERSVAFYRDVGLSSTLRTTPDEPQPGAAFGLDQVQWDAWMMAGTLGFDGVVIDLLEWKVPAPTGATDTSTGTGFRRLRLASPGDGPDHDPDGTPLEIVAGTTPQVAGVEIGCSEFTASVAFYRDVVGLQIVGPGSLADERGPDVFVVDLVPAPKSARPRVANELGMYRMALLTDDIDRDDSALRRAGVQPYSPPAELEMGPGVPPLRALFFPDPDGTTLELIELGTS